KRCSSGAIQLESRRANPVDLPLSRSPHAEGDAGSALVPDRLQEQFGRDFIAQTPLLHQFIDAARNGVELRALKIAALGPRNLIGRRAPRRLAAPDVGERDALFGRHDAMRLLAPAPVAELARGG